MQFKNKVYGMQLIKNDHVIIQLLLLFRINFKTKAWNCYIFIWGFSFSHAQMQHLLMHRFTQRGAR